MSSGVMLPGDRWSPSDRPQRQMASRLGSLRDASIVSWSCAVGWQRGERYYLYIIMVCVPAQDRVAEPFSGSQIVN